MGITTSIFAAALNTLDLIKGYLGDDEKQNLEAVRSSVYDIDADDWNKIVAGLSEVALRTRIGNLATLRFSHPNVTAGAGPTDCYRGGGGDTALTVAISPWSGWVVGIGVHVENARTAGTLTINVEINGTPVSLNVVIDGSNPQDHYAAQDTADAETAGDTIIAGETVEVTWTTDGSWAAGSTPSVDVDVYLALGE